MQGSRYILRLLTGNFLGITVLLNTMVFENERQYMKPIKITSKYQASIPQEIRALLKLKAGDSITFEITANNQVQIRKAVIQDFAYLKSLEKTLDEWSSLHDEKAYRDL